MIEMPITEEDIRLAEEQAMQHLPANIGRPHFQTDELRDKKIGKLGQIKFGQFLFSNSIEFIPQKSHSEPDKFDFKIKEKIADVKARRFDSGTPQDDWGMNYPAQQISKDANCYVFLLISLNEMKARLYGFLSKDGFKSKAVFRRKGEKVTEYFTVRNDMYEVKISDLIPIEKFKEFILN
jgi:hypothetical protein